MATGFNALIGLRHIGLDDGRYWIEIDAGDAHVHERGFVHGGVILSLLDIAMARVVRHGEGGERYMPTIEFNASFLRPIEPGRLRACGTILKRSRTLCRAEATLFDAQGRPCASGRAAFVSQP
ncbi:PaaI family thioesterase [Sphingomonas sp. YL-JM2C]